VAVVPKQLTLEQFLTLPEEEPPLEFEDGRAIPKVSPQGQHSLLVYRLAERINRVAEPAKLALALPDLRVTFGGRSPVLDIAVYVWDRISRSESGRVADDFVRPPDIGIEIVSPDQSVTSVVRRCVWYVENGVRVALLVDPEDESVLVFRPNRLPLVVRGVDRIDLDDLLPGLALTPDELFGSLTV
jgi:Uma2 family endonuclease